MKRRADLPEDEGLVALVALHGSYVGADSALGVPPGTVQQYLSRPSRRALRETCAAFRRAPHTFRSYPSAYPSNAKMVGLAASEGSWSGVARAVGVRRESLRDYLSRRPALRARMADAFPPPPTEAERLERKRERGREYMATRRQADPEGERRKRREHMATYGPEYRRKWNSYNRARRIAVEPGGSDADAYRLVLHRDPCSYCDGSCEHVDHIVPIIEGGDGWGNLTASCARCNQSKSTTPLLHFLRMRHAK